MLRPFLPWLGLSLLAAACSGGGSDKLGESLGSGDGGREDASAEPDAEDPGTQPVVQDGPDAETPTPPTDAQVADDGGARGVRVRVRSPAGPARAVVLLHDEEGSALGSPLPTGPQGEVYTELGPSMVTVLLEDDPDGQLYRSAELITYTGVAAGDVLTVEVAPRYTDASSSYLVALPNPYPNGGGAVDVTGGSSFCASGSTGNNSSVAVFVSCELPANDNTLLASFLDEGGGAWFTWNHTLAAPPPNGQSAVTFEQAWTEGAPLVISLSGVTPNQNLSAWSELSMLYGGTRFPATSVSTGDLLVTGDTYTVPPGFTEEAESAVWYTQPSVESTPRIAAIAKRVPLDAGNVVFGVGEFLDVPQGIRVEPGADPLRPTLRFEGPLAPTGVDALIASATLSWYEGDASTSLRWRAIVPPGATSFTPPVLPPNYVPDPGNGVQSEVRVGIASVGDDVADGFDDYRARPFRVAYNQEYNEVPVKLDATDRSEHKLTAWIPAVGI